MKKAHTKVNKIAKFIRQEITYSNLRSGQHIKESDISQKFKTSRVPVREALRILQSEGYLEVIANRGIFVKAISIKQIHEMGIFYKLLAPVVLEKAIPKYNLRTYEKAEELLNKIETCNDFNKAGYLLWDFAKVIFGPSKMSFILGIFDDIYMHSIRSLNEIFEIKENKNYDTENHRKFLERCKQNKKDEAIRVWNDQINKTQFGIIELLETEKI